MLEIRGSVLFVCLSFTCVESKMRYVLSTTKALMDDNKSQHETFAIFQHWKQQLLRNQDRVDELMRIVFRRLISSLFTHNDNTILVNLIRVARRSCTFLRELWANIYGEFWWNLINGNYTAWIQMSFRIWFWWPKWIWFWISSNWSTLNVITINLRLVYARLGCRLLDGGVCCAVDKLTSLIQRNDAMKQNPMKLTHSSLVTHILSYIITLNDNE